MAHHPMTRLPKYVAREEGVGSLKLTARRERAEQE